MAWRFKIKMQLCRIGVILSVVGTLIGLAAMAAEAPPSAFDAQTKAQSFSSIADLGVISPSQDSVDFPINFTNIQSSTLIIDQVLSACHCTTAKYSKDPISPGSTVRFNVHVDLKSIKGNG